MAGGREERRLRRRTRDYVGPAARRRLRRLEEISLGGGSGLGAAGLHVQRW